MCIQCGHCEISCPSQALLLNVRPDEKVPLPGRSRHNRSRGHGILPEKTAFRAALHERSCPKETDPRNPRHRPVRRFGRQRAAGAMDRRPRPGKGEKDCRADGRMDEDPQNTNHPMSGYVPVLIGAWEAGKMSSAGAPRTCCLPIPGGQPRCISRRHHRAHPFRYRGAGIWDRDLLGGFRRDGCFVL